LDPTLQHAVMVAQVQAAAGAHAGKHAALGIGETQTGFLWRTDRGRSIAVRVRHAADPMKEPGERRLSPKGNAGRHALREGASAATRAGLTGVDAPARTLPWEHAMKTSILTFVAAFLAACMLAIASVPAHAGLNATPEILAEQNLQADRDKVRDFLDRADVEEQLQ